MQDFYLFFFFLWYIEPGVRIPYGILNSDGIDFPGVQNTIWHWHYFNPARVHCMFKNYMSMGHRYC